MGATHQVLLAGSLPPATVSYTDSGYEIATKTTYTFSGKSISTAAANRKVIVAVHGRDATRTVSSITVGGISASFVKREQNSGGTSEIWIASVPTGTTADVEVVWSGDQARTIFVLWAGYGNSSTANDTGNSTANPLTDTMNCPAGGIMVGFAISATASTFGWTNLTENVDGQDTDGITYSGASSAFSTQQTALAITATQSASAQPILVLASFGAG